MSTFWGDFATNAQTEAASIGSDMLPILALIAGVALAATILTIVVNLFRGR